MSYYQKIFLTSLGSTLLGVVIIVSSLGPNILSNYNEFSSTLPKGLNLESQLSLKQSYLDSIQEISQSYRHVNVIQNKLVQQISSINEESKILMHSMPKNHIHSDVNGITHTLQVELEGHFKQQLIAMKKLESELQILQLKSCEFYTKRKKKSYKLIGLFIFQYHSPKS